MKLSNQGRAPARGGSPARGDRWLYGRHPVEAALANPERRWRPLAALPDHETEAQKLVAGAVAERRGDGEAVRVLDRQAFAALLPEGAVHQGLALEIEPLVTPDLADVLRETETAPKAILVVLDQVSDPHNVGAVLRAAAAFGARAVIVATHGAAPATGALAKAASGALELVPLVPVVNLARALDQMKEAGFWCCGLDEAAPQGLAGLDLGPRVALVLGSEGVGLRRLVQERCDFLARLPLTVSDDDRLYVHAEASHPKAWTYVTSTVEASRSIVATPAHVTFCGHVHRPAVYSLSAAAKMTAFTPVTGVPIPLLAGRRWLLVAGSVGQPRDGNPAAAWLMLDTDRHQITFCRTPYDVDAAAAAIRSKGLPVWLAERLYRGV